MESVIATKGRVTIPKAVREHLKLKPGDLIKFFLHPNGGVVLLQKLPTTRHRKIPAAARDDRGDGGSCRGWCGRVRGTAEIPNVTGVRTRFVLIHHRGKSL